MWTSKIFGTRIMIDELKEYFDSLDGAAVDPSELVGKVANVWEQFSGHDAEGMNEDKLSPDRVEDPEWAAPLLTFRIERHGAFCRGSSRAEIHQWTLDLEKMTAICAEDGYRPKTPKSPALRVRPLVAAVVDLIIQRREDDCLKWNDDGSVLVLAGKIIPDERTCKQTLTGRRRRFRAELIRQLREHGWQESSKPYLFTRSGE